LLALLEHPVGGIGNGEQMWGILEELPTLVLANGFRTVDVHLSVGIHRDAHFADVCVDGSVLESGERVMDSRSVAALFGMAFPQDYEIHFE